MQSTQGKREDPGKSRNHSRQWYWKEEKVGAGREGAGWLDGVQGCGPGCM